MARNNVLNRGALYNLLGTGIPLLVGLISVPILLKSLGNQTFGLLTLIWTAIGYFGLFDFGIGRALTQQVASYRSNQNPSIGSLIRTGLISVIIPGIAGAFIMYYASIYYINELLLIDAGSKKDLMQAFSYAAWSIPLVTLSSGLRGILEGFEDFARSSFLRGTLGVLNFLTPMIIVLLGDNSLFHIVLSLIISRMVIVLLNTYWVFPFMKTNQITDKKIVLSNLIDLLKFGFWMTVSNIVGPFMVAADRFIIASILGASILTYYTVPQDIVLRLLIIPAAIATAWFPRFAKLNTYSDIQKSKELASLGYKYIFLILGPICMILALFSKKLLEIWINIEFAENTWLIALILLIGIIFNALAHIPLASLQATGKVKTTAFIHVGELFFYLPLLFYFVPSFGIKGAAVIWTSRAILDFVFLFIFNHYKFNDYSKL